MSENVDALQREADLFKENFAKIKEEVGKVIVGQNEVVDGTLTALICGGNVLLEGVPGLGKTELVKTLSKVLDLNFSRIQFTPDLMPADIIGTNIMVTDTNGNHVFEFRRGPVFTQLLLADEINRATPKTQSALLETMQEGTVTASRETYVLDPPFFVMATQNPLEQEGTYPLPEAQLDRFMFKIHVPYPSGDELNEIVSRTILKEEVVVAKVIDAKKILELRGILNKVIVADPVLDYSVRLVMATHPESEFAIDEIKSFVRWGASPRATQALIRAARVHSLASGRVHVSCNDVRFYAKEVLQHRLILNYDGQAENRSIPGLIDEVIRQIPEERTVNSKQ